MIAPATNRRRRWFQFGLGTLFVVVTAFTVFIGYHVDWIKKRHAFLSRTEGEIVQRSNGRAPGLLWAFGEGGTSDLTIVVSVGDSDFTLGSIPLTAHGEIAEMRSLFPEARISVYMRGLGGGTHALLLVPDNFGR